MIQDKQNDVQDGQLVVMTLVWVMPSRKIQYKVVKDEEKILGKYVSVFVMSIY